MRILLVGATGKLGAAVHQTLAGRGHEVLAVSRNSGDLRFDITDAAQVEAMYAQVGDVDAVASACGHVPFKPFTELSVGDYQDAFAGKVLCQIDLVRQGLRHVAERGSFTLISGVLSREPIVTGSAAAMANGAVEAFVRGAAIEISPRRVNAISPTVFTESLVDYADFFPGERPVDLHWVTQAYVRSIEGALTGQVLVP